MSITLRSRHFDWVSASDLKPNMTIYPRHIKCMGPEPVKVGLDSIGLYAPCFHGRHYLCEFHDKENDVYVGITEVAP